MTKALVQPGGRGVFLGLRFRETGLESPICSAGNPGALCRITVSKYDGLLVQPPSAQGRAERAEERLVISQGGPHGRDGRDSRQTLGWFVDTFFSGSL